VLKRKRVKKAWTMLWEAEVSDPEGCRGVGAALSAPNPRSFPNSHLIITLIMKKVQRRAAALFRKKIEQD
jgi:hypothetical protein